jgi:streptogramin lyase
MRRVALLGVLAAALLAPGAAAADVPFTVTQFPLEEVPGSNGDEEPTPVGITSGPEGNLFVIEQAGNNVIKMTATAEGQEPIASVGAGPIESPTEIATGPDHELWVLQKHGRISRVSPTGVTDELENVGVLSVSGLTAGPSGETAMWFGGPEQDLIGRVTTAATPTFSGFGAGITAGAEPTDITAGPDGNLWFTEPGIGGVGRMTTGGIVTEFTAGITAGAEPTDITAGPDGDLWFTEANENAIGRITTAGVVTQVTAGIPAGAEPSAIVEGPADSLWFTEPGIGAIGQITTAGVVTQYTGGITAGAEISSITEGPDGNIWFTETNEAAVGRLALAPTNTALPALAGNTSAPTQGGTLTAGPGIWSGHTPSFAYQWERSSGAGFAEIPGATGLNLTVGDEDIGDTLRARVTASYLGTAVTVFSPATGAAVPADPFPVPGPTVFVPGPTVQVPGPTVFVPGPTVTVQGPPSPAPTAAEPKLVVSGKPSIAKGTKLVVTCAAACKASAKLTVTAAVAKQYKLGPTTLGTATESALGAGSADLTIKLTPALRKKLAAATKLPAKVQVTVLDASGASKTLTASVTLGR